jgi:hypothetical protein
MPYMIVAQENGGWSFEKYPLIFDHKDIIILTQHDLKQKQEIILLQQAEEISTYCHNQTDLIVVNSKSIHDSPTLVIYSQFYTDIPSQENALSSKLKFFNTEISLKSIINNSEANCTDFNILIKKLNQSQAINSTFTEIFNRSKREINSNKTDNDYQPHHFHLQVYKEKDVRTVITFRFSLNSLIYGSTAACLKEISLRYKHRYTALPNLIDYLIQPTLFAAHSLNWQNSLQLFPYLALNFIFTQLSKAIEQNLTNRTQCKFLNFLLSILTLTLVLNPLIFIQEDSTERFISDFCSHLMDGLLFKISECGTQKLVSYFFKQPRATEENFTEINHYYSANTNP